MHLLYRLVIYFTGIEDVSTFRENSSAKILQNAYDR